ncbi:hypothetical protein J7E50_07480 [Pedobacter sp. ISL-68]|uniref:hypothetical protein n=1 Tax=unclassified Pedobacter TaxID=2628915 RepID=UPI001BEB3917|nr:MULTISPECIES: hypothetical protein [unclassified Pedobacter]MBT2560671.1 hypothetical protein [Pedobacter sp. ISL-64]MBT2590050.1 hypothetical protein [Pedobacter sp. ISL-68]
MKKSITIKKFIASLEKHGTIIPFDKAEAVLELVYELSELVVKKGRNDILLKVVYVEMPLLLNFCFHC